jgi:phytoene synthase
VSRPHDEPLTLTAAYERCRRLHARQGRSYYLATLLLPAWKRPHVHALYGFARYADEIVDDLDSRLSGPERAAALGGWGQRFFAGLRGGRCDDPVLPAVLHTVRAFQLDLTDFERFLSSMAADLEVDAYQTYEHLLEYMAGSAAAIGTMMLPILEPSDPELAREPARQLGFAFQLTNFVRDVGEDLSRGRLYLPLADLARFGVDRPELAAGVVTPPIRALLAFEVERARAHYLAARGGIDLLAPSSRPSIQAAFELYGGILDEVERASYQVFRGRVRVPRRRRAAIFARYLAAGRALARAERRVSVAPAAVPGPVSSGESGRDEQRLHA